MSVNKVVFGNEVKMDLTNDTVSADNLLEGETAHDRSGTPVTGTAKQGHVILDKIKTALTQRAKLWFKDAKVTDDSTEGATAIEIIHSVTESAFDALPTDGTADGLYELSDGDLTPIMAENVGYDNTTSGSSATDLQDAVDDLYSKKLDKSGGTMTGALNVNESSAIQAVFSRSHSDTTSKLSLVVLGNNIAEGTAGSAYGVLRFFGQSSKYIDLMGLPTYNRSINFPDANGTLALKEDLLTDSFTPVGANSTSQAIYQLHGSLSDNQKCSCLLNYGTTELFVTGYRKNSERGRYVALGRTNEDVLAFRVYGNTVSQNVISGTITTETIS